VESIGSVLISYLTKSVSFRVSRFLARGRHAIATGVLIAALLTPFFSGLILFAQDEGRSCQTACCKGGRGSCCHRSRQQGGATGAGWVNLPGCPAGCGHIGLPPLPDPALSKGHREFCPVTMASFPAPAGHPGGTTGEVKFALFGRPPPVSPFPQS